MGTLLWIIQLSGPQKHKGLYLHNFIHAWLESDLQYLHKDWFTVQVQYAFDKTSSSMYWNGLHNI
jgi:hypothetical protein